MAFFDKLNDLAKSIEDITTSTIEKGKNAIEITKLNSKINAERSSIADNMKQIGEHYYEKYAEGEPADPAIAELLANIDRHSTAIRETEEQIRQLREEDKAAETPTAPAPAPSDGIICPSCGKENAVNTKFCGECGSKLEAKPQPKSCPSCGTTVPDGVKFCNDCGAKIG